MELERYQFTKDDTTLMKGLAILLMLAHHLWGFGDRLVSELPMISVTARGMEFTGLIGGYGKICVSMFMFLGGFGTYLWYTREKADWFSKIRKLYLSYWKVFFVFVPIGFLLTIIRGGGQRDYCADTVICHVFDEFHLSQFLANLIGIASDYNREWWFFGSYLAVLAAFPIIVELIRRNSFGINLWIVCLYQILSMYVFPALLSEQYFPALEGSWLYRALICQSAPWAACFWCGCVFAKDHLLERLRKHLDPSGFLHPVIAVVVLTGIFMLRQFVVGAELDVFYVPFMCVYATLLADKMGILKKVVLELGRQSTNMWLLHSFLIYYFYETARVILSVRHVLLVYALFVAASYAAACGVDGIYGWMGRGYLKLQKKNHT